MESQDDSLSRYREKRDFAVTPEPSDKGRSTPGRTQFVIQKHWASQLHYDLRLEIDGTMKSWAVPKGPSLDPADKRMAVQVEDHPISYNRFEGVIPAGQYGAGRVIVWDRGTWEPEGDALEGWRKGRLRFRLQGHKLQGGWALVRMGKNRAGGSQPAWLLIKEKDEHARAATEFSVVEAQPDSVVGLPATEARTRTPAAPRPAPRQRAKALAKPTQISPQLATLVAPVPGGAKKQGRAAGHLATSARPPAALPADSAAEPLITHGERVIDPSTGTTKADLVRYYALVAPLMLPHLTARPVALVRAPDGVGGELFFQKHQEGTALAGLRLLDPALDEGHAPLLEVATAQGLRSGSQMNVVEYHTWNALKDRIDRPDRMTFDLDPGEGVQWAQVQEGARLVRVLLQELGLPAFLKTSGGKGLHVVAPLKRLRGWETVKDFSQAIVAHLARTIPDRFVAKSGPRNRVGKIFVDYLRNGRGATTVSAWSARARPGMGVSVPLDWSELEGLTSATHWNVRNIAARLDVGNMPWEAYGASAVSLGGPMKALGFRPE